MLYLFSSSDRTWRHRVSFAAAISQDSIRSIIYTTFILYSIFYTLFSTFIHRADLGVRTGLIKFRRAFF